MVRGIPFIVAAPSGAGKTSLVKCLVETVEQLRVSVSHTTRPKRKGEKDGINYFFVKPEEFEKMTQQGGFLEFATVFGEHYGTQRQWVEDQLSTGIDVILEIDWQGAQQVRKAFSNAVSIFILPPSREVLEERLCARGQDTTTVIEGRMAQARNEISHCHEFDYWVINDNFNTAVEDLKHIVRAERLRLTYQQPRYERLLKNLLA